ncbi:hypothetical protein HNQ94_000732 [Salirhabdus euzebyi]|uniref:Aminoglycoside phosphotransferase domain-containing protein n=1 Tax=Salirhabdus euzebyi TaxID=394506 RepID=A0A841PTH4_9BACI|nr:hypothetical protein [Salirhabdus euzebyi]MBB6452287.1 hypothetical protein [Salirhabdus euzebyi]
MEHLQQKLAEVQRKENLSNRPAFLGEGAWHYAFLATLKTGEQFVIRFPKEVAYGRKVEFDEKELRAEYGGTQAFYQFANQVQPHICPSFFTYYIHPELTYTMETFAGSTINLHALTETEAFEIGAQYGHFFMEMNKRPAPLEGIGYLAWDEHKNIIRGSHQSNISVFMEEENHELLEDLKVFKHASGTLKIIEAKLKECLQTRNITEKNISFTNQDTSPENILIHHKQIKIIDPFPVLYYGHAFAGNFINNYQTLFLALHNSPRYKKHEFTKVQPILEAVANGFSNSYTGPDKEMGELVKREEFIQLFQTTVDHIRLSEGELPMEKQLRYGTIDVIQRRIPAFLKKLEQFQL